MVDIVKARALEVEGIGYELDGEIDKAIEAYRKALALYPEKSHEASVIWNRCASLFNEIDMNDLALDCCKCGIEACEDNTPIYYELFHRLYAIYSETEKYEIGLEYVNNSLLFYPNEDKLWVMKGMFLALLDKESEGMKCIKKAAMINPNNPIIIQMREDGVIDF